MPNVANKATGAEFEEKLVFFKFLLKSLSIKSLNYLNNRVFQWIDTQGNIWWQQWDIIKVFTRF